MIISSISDQVEECTAGTVRPHLLAAALSRLQRLHLCPKLLPEQTMDASQAANQVNVTIAFESGITGYALFSLSLRAATMVVSMMKGRPIASLDEEGNALLADLFRKVLADTLTMAYPCSGSLVLPPAIVYGEAIIPPDDGLVQARVVLSCQGHKLSILIVQKK